MCKHGDEVILHLKTVAANSHNGEDYWRDWGIDRCISTIVKALQELDFGVSEKLARINSVGSGWEKDDIEAVLPHRPDGIVIPKVESFEDIE